MVRPENRLPSQHDLLRDTHPFAPNVRKSIFLGYVVASGAKWTGQYIVTNRKKLQYGPANRKNVGNIK